jgi:hypothetical protein
MHGRSSCILFEIFPTKLEQEKTDGEDTTDGNSGKISIIFCTSPGQHGFPLRRSRPVNPLQSGQASSFYQGPWSIILGGVNVSAENVQTAFIAALNGPFAKVLSVKEVCSIL